MSLTNVSAYEVEDQTSEEDRSCNPGTSAVQGSAGTLRLLLCTALLIFLSVGADAQTGEIFGTVTDSETGEPVPGAFIESLSSTSGAMSSADGSYRLSQLRIGDHRIRVRSIAHIPDTVLIHITTSDRKIRRDFTLRPASDLTPEQVVIRGQRLLESDAAARHTERSSPTVVSVLSAEAIERTSDISTAEAVQRIPGVSVTRVRGEARTAIIRGMEARYNNLLVNGVRIPSPGTNTRVVNMDFLPSDLLQRIEITKVLTPDMEGDAIGGAINIVTRKAPERPLIKVRLGSGYSSMFFDNDYIGFRTDSIFDDPLERFGRDYLAAPDDFPRDNARLLYSPSPSPDLMGEVTAGTRLLNSRLGVLLGASVQQKYQLSQTARNYEALNADNEPYFTHREFRTHSHSKTRMGFNLYLDYILDADNSIDGSVVSFLRRNRESRYLSDTSYTFAPILYTRERTVFQQHNILSTTLAGHHRSGNLQLDWKTGWAFADQNKPDRAEVTTSNALIGDSIVSERYFHSFDRDWQHNRDEDISGALDITWSRRQGTGLRITAGGLFRSKDRDNYMNAYRLIPIPDSAGNIPRYAGLDSLEWQVANIGGTPEYANNNYQASEQVAAGYSMVSGNVGKLNILGGIRFEWTNSDYSTNDVNLLRTVTGGSSYLDLLPSIHFRYELTEASNLRLSAGRSLSRPEYFDLVPYNYVGGDLREQGNPGLDRTISTNIDLRYEIFPTYSNNLQFSAGTFYKLIENPIETTLDLSNPSLPTLIPKNLGTATNYGLELIGGLQILRSLSILANYTYTHSSITSDKIRFNKGAGITETLQETRSLQGQSAHVANLGLLFKDTAIGTTAQVNCAFTGSRVARVSPLYGLDHHQTDFLVIDFSAEQEVWEHISLFLHLTNILDSPYEVRLANDMLIEKELFGQRMAAGLVARF